jgi:hypothetical protein
VCFWTSFVLNTWLIVMSAALCHVILNFYLRIAVFCKNKAKHKNLKRLTCSWQYRVIHKSLRNFRTRLRINQDRHRKKELSSTCKVRQKLGMSLCLLTCSPSAWPSWLLHRRGRKSQRDLWITLYNMCFAWRRWSLWGTRNELNLYS